MEYFLGFFVGILCGIIPIVFGLLTKHTVTGIIGACATALSGVVFVLFDKSPFTSIGIALVFLIVIFTKNKNKNKDHHDDQDDHDIYLGDE